MRVLGDTLGGHDGTTLEYLEADDLEAIDLNAVNQEAVNLEMVDREACAYGSRDSIHWLTHNCENVVN